MRKAGKKRDVERDVISPIHEAVLTALPNPLLSYKALRVNAESSRDLGLPGCSSRCGLILSPTSTVAPHPDSFLVKLVCSHPSPLVDDLLVKLSVTQDTNRLRVSDNMVIWLGEESLSKRCRTLYNTTYHNHPYFSK